MTGGTDEGSMTKEDRKQQVLDLLMETEMALPPAVLFRNLKLRGATFEYRSVKTYLAELTADGYVRKVSPKALHEGRLEEADSGEAYYIATDRASEFPD
jgi:repressor of nif and glnA expression